MNLPHSRSSHSSNNCVWLLLVTATPPGWVTILAGIASIWLLPSRIPGGLSPGRDIGAVLWTESLGWVFLLEASASSVTWCQWKGTGEKRVSEGTCFFSECFKLLLDFENRFFQVSIEDQTQLHCGVWYTLPLFAHRFAFYAVRMPLVIWGGCIVLM